MATRRTTRATSRAAASSRAESDVSTVVDAPKTPRRVSTRRAGQPPTPAQAGPKPLPGLSIAVSTAYGSNSTVAPGTVGGQEDGERIENVLSKLLDPPTRERRRKGDTASSESFSPQSFISRN